MQGRLRAHFLEQDPPNISFPGVHLITVEGDVVCDLGGTGEAAVYHPCTGEWTLEPFVTGCDDLVTRDDNRRYREQYGFTKYAKKIEQQFAKVLTYCQHGPHKVLFIRTPQGEKMLLNNGEEGAWRAYEYYPNATITNDILPAAGTRFLVTMLTCDSDDSLMGVIFAPDIEGTVINGRPIKGDDNPVLVKYTLKPNV